MLGIGEVTVIVIMLATHALWLWGIVEAIQSKQHNPPIKMALIAVVVVTHFIGASIFLLYRYRSELRGLLNKLMRPSPPSTPGPYEGDTTKLPPP
jgi:hypothetical protein